MMMIIISVYLTCFVGVASPHARRGALLLTGACPITFVMSESYSRGIIIAGPSASGKTTAGELLAEKLQCPFIEGDSLHSPQVRFT